MLLFYLLHVKVSHARTLEITYVLLLLVFKCFSDLTFYRAAPQGRHGRRPGEEESDVDIEGFEEDDDGKPKTPAPVRKTDLLKSNLVS